MTGAGTWRGRVGAVALVLVAALAAPAPVRSETWGAAELRELSADYVRGRLERHPETGTAMGLRDHDGRVDFLSGFPGIFGIGHRPAFRHGHADAAEERAGQVLILRDRLGNGAGSIGFGCQNAALLVAVTEHDQATGVQPAIGNATGHGSIDDGCRAGSQARIVGQFL